MIEELLAQHLESPSRTGRGRVPEPSSDHTASTTRQQRGYSKLDSTHSHWAFGVRRRVWSANDVRREYECFTYSEI